MTDPTPLSSCCKAPVVVDCGDEGTCCHICEKCKHPVPDSDWQDAPSAIMEKIKRFLDLCALSKEKPETIARGEVQDVADMYNLCTKMYHDCCVMREALEKVANDEEQGKWGPDITTALDARDTLLKVANYPNPE